MNDNVARAFKLIPREKMPRVEFLAHLVRKHRRIYYAGGGATITDEAFDRIEDEVRLLCPSHPVLAEVGMGCVEVYPLMPEHLKPPAGYIVDVRDPSYNIREAWTCELHRVAGARPRRMPKEAAESYAQRLLEHSAKVREVSDIHRACVIADRERRATWRHAQ